MNREHDRPASNSIGSTQSFPRQPGEGLDVLLVEDDLDSAESMAMLLRIRGHSVHIVPDGPAAVRASSAKQPDVVLLDIGLPGMDGYSVARRLGQQEYKKRPLLIAVTGRGQDEDLRRSQEAGIDLHLVKPVNPDHLIGLLNRFLTIIK